MTEQSVTWDCSRAGGKLLTSLGGALILLFLVLRHRRQQRGRTPPSLPALPLIGHLHLLPRMMDHAFTASMHEKLGPIFSLRIVAVTLVYVRSTSLAHEVLVKNGNQLASRPTLSGALFTSNFRSINSAPYGPHWRAVRRNLAHHMLNPAKTNLTFKQLRQEIINDLLQRLRTEFHDSECGTDTVVPVYTTCRHAVFRLMLFMLFGFHVDDAGVAKMTELVSELLGRRRGSIGDFVPALSFLDRAKKQNDAALRKKQVEIISFFISRHHEKFSSAAVEDQSQPSSYLETLLRLRQTEPELELSNSDIVSLCTEFLSAGTDTTVTTLEWAMARLVDSPSVQQKLYDEIKNVVGDRAVEEDDLSNLPYLHAVVTETLRLHPPGHFLLPHAPTSKSGCKIGGYDIPGGAVVVWDVVGISRDGRIWEEPLEFKPERMLRVNVDITGTKAVSMIPFGAGRRICPGLGLASVHLELFVARLVQAFEWSCDKSVDFSERPIFTVQMKYPLRARIRERHAI